MYSTISTERDIFSSEAPVSQFYEVNCVQENLGSEYKQIFHSSRRNLDVGNFDVVVSGSCGYLGFFNTIKKKFAIRSSGITHSVVKEANEDFFYSSGKDGDVGKWDTSTGKLIQNYVSHDGTVPEMLKFSKDILVSCQSDGDRKLRVWNTCKNQDKKIVRPIYLFPEEVDIAYPMGKEILEKISPRRFVAISRASIFTFDLERGRRVFLRRRGLHYFNSVKFSDPVLFYGGKRLVIDDLRVENPIIIEKIFGIRSMLVNSEKQQVLLGLRLGMGEFFDVRKMEVVSRFKLSSGLWPNRLVSYNSFSNVYRFLSISNCGTVRLWNWKDCENIHNSEKEEAKFEELMKPSDIQYYGICNLENCFYRNLVCVGGYSLDVGERIAFICKNYVFRFLEEKFFLTINIKELVKYVCIKFWKSFMV